MSGEYDLPDYSLLHTRDFKVCAETIGKHWRPHQGTKDLKLGKFEASIYMATLSQLALLRIDIRGGAVTKGGPLESLYTIAVPLEGSLVFELEDEKIEVTGKTGSVYSAGLQHEIVMSSHVKLINVRIQRKALEEELEILLGRKMSAPILFELVLDLTGDFGQQVLSLLRYLVAEVNTLYPKSLVDSLTLRHAERTLLILLLEHQPHNYSREMRTKDADPVNWQVLRAEEYVRVNLDRNISVGDVARGAGVTERTLSSAFKKERGCTPVQFIRQSKLEAVRQKLLSGKKGDSVTDIANRWGFVHSGHFSKNYLKLFGETPSQTLKGSVDI
jgi:AraC-like DNA-binding protein